MPVAPADLPHCRLQEALPCSQAAARLQPVQDVLQAFGANLIELSKDSPEADIEPLAKQGVPAFGLLQDGRVGF